MFKDVQVLCYGGPDRSLECYDVTTLGRCCRRVDGAAVVSLTACVDVYLIIRGIEGAASGVSQEQP